MATIQHAEAHIIHRPSAVTLATSYGRPAESRDHVIVVLRDSDGRKGLGEASALPFFTGETPASIHQRLEETFLPALFGKDATSIAAIQAELDHLLPENSSAKAAANMALYDLAGRTLGVPVSTLLGGVRRQRVPITRPIGIKSTEDAVTEAVQYVSMGHTTLKFKVGGNTRKDIDRIISVREAIGPDTRIRIDANQGYDLPSAIRILRALESVDLEYFEQPLPRHNISDLARLRAQVGTKIAVDESLHNLQDAVALIQARAVDVFVIKLIKTGGPLGAKRITDLAEAFGVKATVVSPFDTQIGAAHGLLLAQTLPEDSPACELTVFATQSELATTQHRLAHGFLEASGDPGVGVENIRELDRNG